MLDIPRRIAVIGTAGRDKAHVMDSVLWSKMVTDLAKRIVSTDTLVSGGAAWADHLAVNAYLNNQCANLMLFLPAPFLRGKFVGEYPGAGNTSNYYHKRFGLHTGVNSLKQIELAITKGATVEFEPVSVSCAAMFVRNKKVAACATTAIAYTFGAGSTLADGGTWNTWKQITADDKVHVSLISI